MNLENIFKPIVISLFKVWKKSMNLENYLEYRNNFFVNKVWVVCPICPNSGTPAADGGRCDL
jgi:hypothetical protein